MSDEARCQAWVRLSLNQQLLGSYLETIEHDRHTRDLATASYTVGAPPVARVATTVATHFLLQRARDPPPALHILAAPLFLLLPLPPSGCLGAT